MNEIDKIIYEHTKRIEWFIEYEVKIKMLKINQYYDNCEKGINV
jgi:hypothetical protein